MNQVPRRRPVGTRTAAPAPRPGRERGQSVVEFALVVPLLILMVVAIADFGRIYASAVAVEAAEREAADYGAFKSSYWLVDGLGTDNPPITVAEMERRACTAAAGSHLEGYAEPAGTIAHATCTNPSFTCTLVQPDGTTEVDCGSYTGAACSTSTTDPPCLVHVRLTYAFRTFLDLPPLPGSVTLERDSRYAISDLPTP